MTRAEPLQKDGLTLFGVTVVRQSQQTFYVTAPDLATARQDAEVLADGLDSAEWEEVDVDINVTAARSDPPAETMFWTGGPDGDWEVW